MSAAEELAAELGQKPRTGGGRPTAYRTQSGKKVPGVTTILNRCKDSGGLIYWAWQQGCDGKDYRQTRDDAGSVGHYAHALVDAEIRGCPPPPRPAGMSDEDEKRARKALESFCAWRDQVRFDLVDTEMPLVSELWHFGGTRDCLARVNGETVLLDWKSSNAVYREHVAQCGAYRQLAREHGHSEVNAAGLLRFGKTHGDFTYHFWPESAVDVGWDAFRWALRFYEADQQLKEIVR